MAEAMNKREENILIYAKAIKKYCNVGINCDKCIFDRSDGMGCGLWGEPPRWKLPKAEHKEG